MFQEFCVSLALLALTVYFLLNFFGKSNFWKKRNVPSLKSGFFDILFKSDWDMDCDLYEQQKKKNLSYGGIVELGTPRIIISDPELIKLIMVKDFDSMVERPHFPADPFFRRMMFAMRGPNWRRMRNHMTPTFTTGRIKQMYQVFQEFSAGFIKILHEESPKPMDLSDIFHRLSMTIINSVAFGVQGEDVVRNPDSIFLKKARGLQNFAWWKTKLLFLANGVYERLGLSCIDPETWDFFAQHVKAAIKLREESGEKRNDFIQLMLEAKWASKEITDQEIVAQCILFIFAAFDTMGNSIQSFVAQAGTRPEIQDRLYQELKKAQDGSNGQLSYEVIQKCEYLDAFIKEVLRMFPVAPRIDRCASVDYTIPGTESVIPKGAIVTIFPVKLHKDPRYHSDPETFDPERFLPQNRDSIHPYAFLPFGAGPRNCIGDRFALAQSKAIIADIIVNFNIEPTPKTEIPIRYSSSLNLRPISFMEFVFTPRDH